MSRAALLDKFADLLRLKHRVELGQLELKSLRAEASIRRKANQGVLTAVRDLNRNVRRTYWTHLGPTPEEALEAEKASHYADYFKNHYAALLRQHGRLDLVADREGPHRGPRRAESTGALTTEEQWCLSRLRQSRRECS